MTVTSTLPTSYPRSRDDRGGALEQVEARRALPLRIGIGEVTADVAQSRGAENGIGDRVAGDVGVGMAEPRRDPKGS